MGARARLCCRKVKQITYKTCITWQIEHAYQNWDAISVPKLKLRVSSWHHDDTTHVANEEALYGELDVFGTFWNYISNLQIIKAP